MRLFCQSDFFKSIKARAGLSCFGAARLAMTSLRAKRSNPGPPKLVDSIEGIVQGETTVRVGTLADTGLHRHRPLAVDRGREQRFAFYYFVTQVPIGAPRNLM
jgi:hypothetical protein